VVLLQLYQAGSQDRQMHVAVHAWDVDAQRNLATSLHLWCHLAPLRNLDLKPLVDAKVYEFAFIWAPLKLIGGTGSAGNPIAIY
jgi:hypothetical protein